ncbi:MAG TPA: CGNR zinc finger domain-containing protein [Terriglobales bacterium]|nr:CGNR zinc finger domain-containing protein [Terriglobales bacterium]
MSQPALKTHFDLSGGNLALDFVNTVSHRPSEQPVERLTDYTRLVFFGLESGVYKNTDRLFMAAGRAPGQAKSALQKAIEFREALFAIFSAIVEHRTIPDNPLLRLSLMLQEANANGRIVHRDRRFVWEWINMDQHLASVQWAVARAASELLLSDDLSRLRMCAADDCAWLFLDHTKNQRRRWCDMKTCGNRVKARRHYERLKGA